MAHPNLRLEKRSAMMVAEQRARALLVCGALMVLPATAPVHGTGQGPVPRSGACFYRDAEYRGQYVCVASGEKVESLPNGLRNEVSSIRLFGGAEVKVYEHQNFDGKTEVFTSDVTDLQRRGWNDKVSGVEVWRRGSGADPDVIVRRAYQDLLDRNPDQAGLHQYRSRIIDDGWTEQQVRDDIRKSPEYREKNTMTYAKAQQIVRNAYLAVLNREPDPASQSYVNKVLRDKWTQQDVERELRKSPEYLNRPR